MKILNQTQHLNHLKNCNSGKHKLRTNKFGVTWCVYCGCLSNAESEPLNEDDKVLYVQE